MGNRQKSNKPSKNITGNVLKTPHTNTHTSAEAQAIFSCTKRNDRRMVDGPAETADNWRVHTKNALTWKEPPALSSEGSVTFHLQAKSPLECELQ